MRWLVLLLGAAGCAAKLLYLPGSGGSEWSQAGSSAAGAAFQEAGPEPPLRLYWQQQLDAAPLGGPLVDGQLLLQMTTGPALYAFDRYSGQRLGRQGYSAPLCGPPSLSGALIALAEAGPKPALRGFDREQGQWRWTYPGLVCAPIAGRGDTLVAALSGGEVVALRAAGGARLWRAAVEGRLWAAPALGGGMAFVGNDRGRVTALALDSGQERWRQELDGELRGLAVREGRVFAATAAGTIAALDTVSGAMLWQVRLGASPAAGLALSGGILAVGAVDHHLYGVDLEAGRVAWSFKTGGVVRGAPAATSRTIYCGSSDQYLYAVERDTGRLVWKYPLDGQALQPVSLGRELVAVATEEGTIYVFGK